ncbi:hypothetical protein [Nocardiopsis sp. ATB16-24]|uniref:hypothetical protein n=1 Tax=Nocardiopsis sp. ATB16-24 TaxID=3019555 RepID=UPI002557AAB1|nr:hypothetical protein [Nocardiopsis sp. ATB16-24]
MNAFLLYAVRTSSEPRNAPTFPLLVTHPTDKNVLGGANLYHWAVDTLGQGYELGLYSAMHIELDDEGDERFCFREEMLLWDGTAVLNRHTSVFGPQLV